MANVVITVLEADGVTTTNIDVLGLGRQAEAASKSIALSNEDKAKLDAAVTALELVDDVVATGGVAALTKGLQIAGSDGTNARIIKVDATGSVATDVESLPADPLGANADSAVTAGSTGSISGKLRTMSGDLDSIKTSVQLLDDAIIADDAAFVIATTKVLAIGALADDTSPDSVNEGDIGAPRMSLARVLYANMRLGDAAAAVNNGTSDTTVQRVTIASDSSGNIATIGTSVTPGTGATNLGKAEDQQHVTGDVGVMSLAVRSDTASAKGADGDYHPILVDSAGRVHVNVGAGGAASGTAGTPSADVITVQGAVGMTPVLTSGVTTRKTITFTTDTAAYASGDLIADTQQLDAFFRIADGTGMIHDMTLFDKADQTAAGMFVLVHQTTTSMGTENSAPNISDANAVAGIIGVIPVVAADWLDIGGCKVATIRGINMPVKAVSGTDDLYFSIVNSTGTPTFAADSLFASFGVSLD